MKGIAFDPCFYRRSSVLSLSHQEEQTLSNLDPAKKNSIVLTEGPNRAAARSYLRGVGFSKDDLHKPIIGVANTWTEIGPCNFHLRDVAAAVKQGIRDAGGTPMEFNTITISDGITMGTEGMKASLISREVIADSIERAAARLGPSVRGMEYFFGLISLLKWQPFKIAW